MIKEIDNNQETLTNYKVQYSKRLENQMFHIPNGMELVIIALLILVLFGGKKIPEFAKGLGSGIKNFKNALNEHDETNKTEEAKTTTLKVDEKIS